MSQEAVPIAMVYFRLIHPDPDFSLISITSDPSPPPPFSALQLVSPHTVTPHSFFWLILIGYLGRLAIRHSPMSTAAGLAPWVAQCPCCRRGFVIFLTEPSWRSHLRLLFVWSTFSDQFAKSNPVRSIKHISSKNYIGKQTPPLQQ